MRKAWFDELVWGVGTPTQDSWNVAIIPEAWKLPRCDFGTCNRLHRWSSVCAPGRVAGPLVSGKFSAFSPRSVIFCFVNAKEIRGVVRFRCVRFCTRTCFGKIQFGHDISSTLLMMRETHAARRVALGVHEHVHTHPLCGVSTPP